MKIQIGEHQVEFSEVFKGKYEFTEDDRIKSKVITDIFVMNDRRLRETFDNDDLSFLQSKAQEFNELIKTYSLTIPYLEENEVQVKAKVEQIIELFKHANYIARYEDSSKLIITAKKFEVDVYKTQEEAEIAADSISTIISPFTLPKKPAIMSYEALTSRGTETVFYPYLNVCIDLAAHQDILAKLDQLQKNFTQNYVQAIPDEIDKSAKKQANTYKNSDVLGALRVLVLATPLVGYIYSKFTHGGQGSENTSHNDERLKGEANKIGFFAALKELGKEIRTFTNNISGFKNMKSSANAEISKEIKAQDIGLVGSNEQRNAELGSTGTTILRLAGLNVQNSVNGKNGAQILNEGVVEQLKESLEKSKLKAAEDDNNITSESKKEKPAIPPLEWEPECTDNDYLSVTPRYEETDTPRLGNG